MVIGDGKGRVGLGTGKSWEVVDAIAKAIASAKKHLVTVQMDDGTIPHDITVKYKAARLIDWFLSSVHTFRRSSASLILLPV